MTISPDCSVLVPVQKFQKSPVELEEGMKLGMIETMCQIGHKSETSVQCARVLAEKQSELLACLKLPEDTLTVEQSAQLQELFKEYSEVFALTKSEGLL